MTAYSYRSAVIGSVRDAFMAVESAWREIAAINPVRDFKTLSTYSLTGDMKYKLLSPSGEIQHGTMGDTTYTNKADTYARMLAITRQDLKNDDLSALTRVPRMLGRGAALALNDKFWTIFLNNSSFFTSGRGNESSGAGSALALAGLNAAEIKFRALTDPDDHPMGHTPRILLVPSALKYTANQLMLSNNLSSTAAWNSTTGAEYGTTNVFAGRFKVVSSAYMSIASITGYSAAYWYLLADPADVPVIEVIFVDGKDVPTVDSADADFDQLGIQLRGYYDFGVALQEYRGGVKSLGS